MIFYNALIIYYNSDVNENFKPKWKTKVSYSTWRDETDRMRFILDDQFLSLRMNEIFVITLVLDICGRFVQNIKIVDLFIFHSELMGVKVNIAEWMRRLTEQFNFYFSYIEPVDYCVKTSFTSAFGNYCLQTSIQSAQYCNHFALRQV